MRQKTSALNQKIQFMILTVVALMGLSACGKQVHDWAAGAVRLPAVQVPPIHFKNAASSEFVPASRQYVQTLQRGYFTSSSAGAMTAPVVETSTQRGYKIYSSVQGVVLSQENIH